ncbi:MAG TPA: DUF2177 family protein [Burkholderiaceae bacterium]|jgi:uncharacterized membrane protein|nr:DUF2177 family protein [Burkholderiaceae bacterium]
MNPPTRAIAPRRGIALRAYATALVAFLCLDAVWLTLTGARLYRPVLGDLMRPDFDVLPAALFYVVYVAGVVRFVVLPSRSVREAALQGAFFGFVAYAAYDLTNQATLVAWRWHLTLFDLAWGSVASATACAIAWLVCCRNRR